MIAFPLSEAVLACQGKFHGDAALLDQPVTDVCIDSRKAAPGALYVPIICALGAGNRLDPSRLRIADIYETSLCPLARVMRREVRKRGVRSLTVAYSTEPPIKTVDDPSISCRYHCVCPPGTVWKCTVRRDIPGSTAFVPPAMGLLIASHVTRELIAAQTDEQ